MENCGVRSVVSETLKHVEVMENKLPLGDAPGTLRELLRAAHHGETSQVRQILMHYKMDEVTKASLLRYMVAMGAK